MMGDKITAANGKVLRRISDGQLFGNVIYLGWAFPKNDEPYLEQPEDFEEIDDPVEAAVLLDEETPLEAMPQELSLLDEQVENDVSDTPEQPVKRVVTMSDYRELEKKVELLMKLIGGTA